MLVKFEATTCGVRNLDDFVTVPEEECVVLLVLFEILFVGDLDAAVEIDIGVGEEDMLVDFMAGIVLFGAISTGIMSMASISEGIVFSGTISG